MKTHVIVVVIAAVVLVASLSLFVGPPKPSSSKEAAGEGSGSEQAAADIRAMKTALDRYRRQSGRYPTTSEGLEVIREYMDGEVIPDDPWGNPYVYELVDGSRYLIVSYGADGREGEGGLGESGGEAELGRDIRSDELADRPEER